MTKAAKEDEKTNVNHAARNKERFLLRLPLEVRNYLQAVSYKSCRSMNSEILLRLTHSLANFDTISSEDLDPKDNNKNSDDSEENIDRVILEQVSKLSAEKKKHLLGFLKGS